MPTNHLMLAKGLSSPAFLRGLRGAGSFAIAIAWGATDKLPTPADKSRQNYVRSPTAQYPPPGVKKQGVDSLWVGGGWVNRSNQGIGDSNRSHCRVAVTISPRSKTHGY